MLDHEMSLVEGGGIRGWGQGIHLTTGQPAQSSTKLGHRCLYTGGWGQGGCGVRSVWGVLGYI